MLIRALRKIKVMFSFYKSLVVWMERIRHLFWVCNHLNNSMLCYSMVISPLYQWMLRLELVRAITFSTHLWYLMLAAMFSQVHGL